MRKRTLPVTLHLAAASCLAFVMTSAQVADASTVYWTDWQTSLPGNNFTGAGDFTAFGTITTPTTAVAVTYHNAQGIAFYQTGAPGQPDYFQAGGGRFPATSPYTSALVDNIPTAAEMIALQYAGNQTLSFSQAIANPVFSYVSLNGNGYSFNQDFDILSVGSVNGKDSG